MDLLAIYRQFGSTIIDYQSLMTYLTRYHAPRDKITRWLHSGDLIRIKKGLYLFSQKIVRQRYQLELLANLIYGPSAVSLYSALAFYGLIPEKVTTVYSITNKRNKNFQTPVGRFEYCYMNTQKYAVGLQLVLLEADKQVLMATPEKAICDILYFSSAKNTLQTLSDLEDFLLSDLRLELQSIQSLDLRLLEEIDTIYKQHCVSLFVNYRKIQDA